MADEQKTDDIEEFEILETPPGDDDKDQTGKQASGAEADDDDGEEDDRRLALDDGADDDDGADGDSMSLSKKKRLKQKERRRRAQDERRQREDFLLSQISALSQKVQQLEGASYAHSESSIENQIAEARRQYDMADEIFGKALDAGNGEDARQALRIRDAANARMQQLEGVKTQVSTAREQVSNTPVADPMVERNKREWIDANADWYDGKNADSQIVRTIDAQVAAAGYDPRTQDYWRELTRRTNAYFSAQRQDDDDDDLDDMGSAKRQQAAPRRKAPPTGMTRETVGGDGKRQIYVTPEQKQAMIDAGYWDDPVKRNRVLKRYAEQSRQASAR